MIKPETVHVTPLPTFMGEGGELDLTTRIYLAEQEYTRLKRSTPMAYVSFFFGWWFGAHRFYVGHFRMGAAMAFTLGFFGLALLDVFTLPIYIRETNAMIHRRITDVYGITEPEQADAPAEPTTTNA